MATFQVSLAARALLAAYQNLMPYSPGDGPFLRAPVPVQGSSQDTPFGSLSFPACSEPQASTEEARAKGRITDFRVNTSWAQIPYDERCQGSITRREEWILPGIRVNCKIFRNCASCLLTMESRNPKNPGFSPKELFVEHSAACHLRISKQSYRNKVRVEEKTSSY